MPRSFASAPTIDTERRVSYAAGTNWSPSAIEIFGHHIKIDIPTGNLLISTTDISYPYYNFSLGVSRKYDAQEQHMQRTYLHNYPNVNPKPHWFGNWQFAYEADVDEVWHGTYPELHVTSGVGSNGLFNIKKPDFNRNIKNGNLTEGLLRSYGIPGRTLAELDWKFTKNDFLLRTFRGTFQILAGYIHEETLVDCVDAKMWLFTPVTGSGAHLTSEFFYNIPGAKYRDVGYPLVVKKLTDALGHIIKLLPINVDDTTGEVFYWPDPNVKAPFRLYTLIDGSNRKLFIALDKELTYRDGSNPGGKVRKYLVSKVSDDTKNNFNIINYIYNDAYLLEEVVFPSTVGKRYIKYFYDDPDHPETLTAIENSFGHKMQFEYIVDSTDNDERLNPRLKIKRIIDPEGITFEYDYNHNKSEVVINILQNGTPDSNVKYTYIQDIHNTKKRYITSTQTEVRGGYVTNTFGAVVPRQVSNPQVIRHTTEYTKNGRFNVDKEIDPLNRVTRYTYNDFNQVESMWDPDGHWTKHTYDLPANPTQEDPRRYDLVRVEHENILHEIDGLSHGRPFVIKPSIIITEILYHKYNASNSNDGEDHAVVNNYGGQSTHRIHEHKDERQKVWIYNYEDPINNNPLFPTLIKSPLNNTISKKYNNRGEVLQFTDSENNEYWYTYTPQSDLKTYTDPNLNTITFTYYEEASWLKSIIDQKSKTTHFDRDKDGRLKRTIDNSKDAVDYRYEKNGRTTKIIQHRPKITSDPTDPSLPSLIIPYNDLVTEIGYGALGSLTRLKNPQGLEIIFAYDEAGRPYHWFHNVSGQNPTKYLYDVAGQLERTVDRKGNNTVYTYDNIGQVKSVQYPDWNDGAGSHSGKLVKFQKYDYAGRPLTIDDSEIGGKKEFTYDEAGNLLVRRDPDGFELHFTYDHDERLFKVWDFNGEYELNLNMDKLGRARTLEDSAVLDGSLKWKYDYKKTSDGITKVLNLFRRSLPALKLKSEYDFDERSSLNKIEHYLSDTMPTKTFSQEFTFRDDGLIDEIKGDDANTFRYDGLKQLIYEHTGNISIDYDEAGNRLHRHEITALSDLQNDSHNTLNRLKKSEGLQTTYKYDGNGNISESIHPGGITNYSFDGSNRLRVIKTDQLEAKYLYDYEGRLVEIEHIAQSSSGTHSEKVHFRYLHSKPIIITHDNNPFMLLTWDPAGVLLRIRHYQITNTSSYPNSLFALSDGFNDVVRLLDADKNIRVSVAYDPWGITSITDPDNLFDYLGYRGGLLDKRTGNVLFGARWYSPGIGRWISEDLYVLNGSSADIFQVANNLYVYALNSPLNFSDPSGLQAERNTLETLQGLEKKLFGTHRSATQQWLQRKDELNKELNAAIEVRKKMTREQRKADTRNRNSEFRKLRREKVKLMRAVDESKLEWLAVNSVISKAQGAGVDPEGLINWKETVLTGGTGAIVGLTLGVAGLFTGITEAVVIGFLTGVTIDAAYDVEQYDD